MSSRPVSKEIISLGVSNAAGILNQGLDKIVGGVCNCLHTMICRTPLSIPSQKCNPQEETKSGSWSYGILPGVADLSGSVAMKRETHLYGLWAYIRIQSKQMLQAWS